MISSLLKLKSPPGKLLLAAHFLITGSNIRSRCLASTRIPCPVLALETSIYRSLKLARQMHYNLPSRHLPVRARECAKSFNLGLLCKFWFTSEHDAVKKVASLLQDYLPQFLLSRNAFCRRVD